MTLRAIGLAVNELELRRLQHDGPAGCLDRAAAANRFAIAAPMPRELPVTSATFPLMVPYRDAEIA